MKKAADFVARHSLALGVFARGLAAASQFASLTRPVAFGAGASPHGSRTPARGGYPPLARRPLATSLREATFGRAITSGSASPRGIRLFFSSRNAIRLFRFAPLAAILGEICLKSVQKIIELRSDLKPGIFWTLFAARMRRWGCGFFSHALAQGAADLV